MFSWLKLRHRKLTQFQRDQLSMKRQQAWVEAMSRHQQKVRPQWPS